MVNRCLAKNLSAFSCFWDLSKQFMSANRSKKIPMKPSSIMLVCTSNTQTGELGFLGEIKEEKMFEKQITMMNTF